MTRLMPQGDDNATDVAEFGKHQFARVGDIVGIADAENFAAAVKVTDGRGVFRSRCRPGGRMPFGGGSALPLHRIPQFVFLLHCIVNNFKSLKNIAKVISECCLAATAPSGLATA